MAAQPAAAHPAAVPVVRGRSIRNPLAWRHSLVSAAALGVAAFLILLALGSPYAALTYIGPLILAGGVVAVVASRLRVRLPVAAYPVLVAGIATAVNAPVLDLLF